MKQAIDKGVVKEKNPESKKMLQLMSKFYGGEVAQSNNSTPAVPAPNKKVTATPTPKADSPSKNRGARRNGRGGSTIMNKYGLLAGK
jgi:hypothetical protein